MKVLMIQRVHQAHPHRLHHLQVHLAKRSIPHHFHKSFAQVHEVLELFSMYRLNRQLLVHFGA